MRAGEVIAYPTEAVYGLGCDPFNPWAVEKLLALKGRSLHKGLILINDNAEQFLPLIAATAIEDFRIVAKNWPGPSTWLFKAAEHTPFWLTGDHDTIALRVTAHPIAADLCRQFGGPIVSTSANLSGRRPARNPLQIRKQGFHQLAKIVYAETGGLKNPTPVMDAETGKLHRF